MKNSFVSLIAYTVIAFAIGLVGLIFIWLIQDYRERMVIHNASYQCMYGKEEYC